MCRPFLIDTQRECWCCFKQRKKLSDEETASEMVDRVGEKEKEKKEEKGFWLQKQHQR